MEKSLLIVGAGRVGRSLAITLKEKNFSIFLWSRNEEKAKNFCKKYKINLIENLKEFKGNFIIFAVKDNALEKLAKKFSKEIKTKGIAIHTSGILNEKVLKPLEDGGWEIGKCHPIFSFPYREKIIPPNIYYGLQGKGKTLKKIKKFVKILGGNYIEIKMGLEPHYHLALTIGSNFPALLFLNSLSIFEEKFKLGEKPLRPLFYQTIENIFKEKEKGITGPAVREDRKTINIHINILKKSYPELLKIYNLFYKEIIKKSSKK